MADVCVCVATLVSFVILFDCQKMSQILLERGGVMTKIRYGTRRKKRVGEM